MSSFYGVKAKNLLRQYRDYLSDFGKWDQKSHAKKWLLYPSNLGEQLSIDETSLSHGELYTIVTNKAAKGKKGSIVAIVAGTKAETVISVLHRITERARKKVKEITLDMAGNMELICKRCFPEATRVTDRFHVQKLATEALQEMRIKHRWAALDAENEAIEQSRKNGTPFQQETLQNGDTIKQLLARSRYILYKNSSNWTESQKARAELLFERYPDLKTAYGLSMGLSQIFNNTKDKIFGLANLARWHEKVRQTGFKAFNTTSRSIQNHYETILNYFDNRSTNASAESFNAKIKAFRTQFRGVKNVEFFLYRLTQLYA
ncbi:MAG: DDE transposase [Pedobacter sp.]|nr:MAG: DDE transposase [Pedobacter sp.]